MIAELSFLAIYIPYLYPIILLLLRRNFTSNEKLHAGDRISYYDQRNSHYRSSVVGLFNETKESFNFEMEKLFLIA